MMKRVANDICFISAAPLSEVFPSGGRLSAPFTYAAVLSSVCALRLANR